MTDTLSTNLDAHRFRTTARALTRLADQVETLDSSDIPDVDALPPKTKVVLDAISSPTR